MNLRTIIMGLVMSVQGVAMGGIATSLSRNPAYLGETVTLRLHEAAGIPHDPVNSVDGVKWLAPAGERVGKDLALAFTPTKTGTVELGSITFRYANGKVMTVTLPSLTVLDNGIGDEVALEFRSPLSKVSVGQAVPVSVRLLASTSLLLKEERRRPTVKVDDSVWRHHTTNTDDRRFQLTTGDIEVGEKPYRFWQYDGILFPSAEGRLAGYATISVSVILKPKKRNNPFMEDIFGSERRMITIERRVPLSPVSVQAAPASPDGVHDLGLIGDFKTTLSARPTTVPLDGDATIRFTARGDGNLELCRTPLLSVPGWRCFKPQKRVDLTARTVTLEWVVQPRGHARPLNNLIIGHYAPAQSKWYETSLTDTIIVEGGKGSGKPPLPLVVELDMGFDRPTPTLALILSWAAGPLITLFVFAFLAWRKPLRIRRFEGRRRRLIARLSKAGATDVSDLLSADLLSALRELCQVPPGMALGEFRERLGDDAFADLVEASLQSSYKPDSDGQHLNDLVAGLKRFRPPLVVAAFALLLFVHGQDTPQDAYARYDFAEAAKGFQTELAGEPTVGSMLNLGQCKYLTQDFAGALLCAERALRVVPRHPVALRLRRTSLEKLDRPAEDSPIADRLLPKELALLGATLWTIGWLALLPLGWRSSRRSIVIGLTLIVCGIIIGLLSWNQWRLRWNPDQLIVIRETPLHTIAAVQEAGDVVVTAATQVRLVEETEGWVRINTGKNSGWVPRDAIGRLVPASGQKGFEVY